MGLAPVRGSSAIARKREGTVGPLASPSAEDPYVSYAKLVFTNKYVHGHRALTAFSHIPNKSVLLQSHFTIL